MRYAGLMAGALLVATVGSVQAQVLAQDDATATYTIPGVHLINVANPDAWVFVAPTTAGSTFEAIAAKDSEYEITTNSSSVNIMASATVPTGLTLTLNMSAPTGGTSANGVAMDGSALALVTGIPAVNQENLNLSWLLEADITAAPADAAGIVVTFTVIDEG